MWKKKRLQILEIEQMEAVNPEGWEMDGVSPTAVQLTDLGKFLAKRREAQAEAGTLPKGERRKSSWSFQDEEWTGDSCTDRKSTSPEGVS